MEMLDFQVNNEVSHEGILVFGVFTINWLSDKELVDLLCN